MRHLIFVFALVVSICFAGVVNATLWDRGGGLIYDDVLDITWLQDANYAKTSGSDSDGLMIWDEAMTWVAELVYYDSVRDVYWDDWRLPSVMNLDGSDPIEGYLMRGSEMGHLFYIDLKNPGWAPISNKFPFENLQADYYWYKDEGPINNYVWFFNFALGYQNGRGRYGDSLAWAVRPGDVGAAPIPEPWTMWLLGIGLIGLGVFRGHKR